MIYTVTFNPALDYVVRVDKLESDDIIRSEEEHIYYGGKGINVSVILTRLGIDNTALGFLAGFTGAQLEEMLKKDNICCDFNYLKNGRTRINVKLKADREIDINANGPIITEEDIEAFFKKLDNVEKGDFIVLAGSVPSSLNDNIYEELFKRLSARDINFVVDAQGDLLLNILKYKPFLIKPNQHELGALFGVKADTQDKIIKYAKELQHLGAKNVLVSRAQDGAVLLDEYGNIFTVDGVKGKLVNSTSCGDSMVAGFLAGYLKTGEYNTALKLGCACGSATAFSPGLAERENIEKLFAQID